MSGALLHEPCGYCDAPAGVRCPPTCANEARPRSGDPEAEADLRRRYPMPVRSWSPAFQALLRATPPERT
jgi:hypothetical protein